MNKKKLELGRLEEIDIRTLWAHEQYDFSEWISQEDNIELLNETIGLTLTEIQKEVAVGAYRCDLVAVDETTGIKVIVENQLDSTNHDHLGKIITYASDRKSTRLNSSHANISYAVFCLKKQKT